MMVGLWLLRSHDNDLVPFGASASERDQIVSDFKKALEDTGMVVPMATTNLFSHPIQIASNISKNAPPPVETWVKRYLPVADRT